jgi:glucokinase
MTELAVGVDIGGTKIQTAAVRGGAIVGSDRAPTPQRGAKELVAAVGEAIARAVAEAGAGPGDVAGIGVGVPGAVDASAGTVENANNVPGLESDEAIPLASMVSAAAGGPPVRLENDVRAAILGEWQRGAGRPFRNLLGVWVGTGVGGGLVLDGTLYEGRGSAGEIGHTTVKPGGRMCSDGRRGHLEAYAGRGRMEVRARNLAKNGRTTILFELMEKKGRTRLSSGIIVDALAREDRVARELIDDAAWALGIALASAQNLLALEAVVIGGGLGDRLGTSFAERVAAEMQPQLFVPERAPVLLMSEFRDLSGAVGAAVLVGG